MLPYNERVSRGRKPAFTPELHAELHRLVDAGFQDVDLLYRFRVSWPTLQKYKNLPLGELPLNGKSPALQSEASTKSESSASTPAGLSDSTALDSPTTRDKQVSA